MSKIFGKWKDFFKDYISTDKKGGGSSLISHVIKSLRQKKRHNKDTQSLALGVLIASGAATARALYAKPSVKSTFESTVDKLFTGRWEEYKSLGTVKRYADLIAELLKSNNVVPERLAVDGLPGSGKSTLARALAERLDFQWKSLDGMNLNKPIDFSESKAVYEHHRLLRTHEPDNFDAIIYIDEPVEMAKARVVKRKRMAIVVDIWDFDKLKQIGDKAFAICNGAVHAIPNSNIKIKIKPRGGFGAYENIASELFILGINSEGLSKEQLLFLSIDGKARQGLNAYINTSAYNQELLAGLTAGLRELFQPGKDD